MNDPTVAVGAAINAGVRFAGVDWASADHAACVVDAAGGVLERLVIEHSKTGLGRLVRRLQAHGVARVGIERPDGPLVEALLAAGLAGGGVPPRQGKHLRAPYPGAGQRRPV